MSDEEKSDVSYDSEEQEEASEDGEVNEDDDKHDTEEVTGNVRDPKAVSIEETAARRCTCGHEVPHVVNQGYLTEEQFAILRSTKCNGFCPIHKSRKILDPKTAIRSEVIHMNECIDCRAEHDERERLKFQTMKEWTCLICGKAKNFSPHCRVCDAAKDRKPIESILEYESCNASWFQKREIPDPDEPDGDGATELVHASWQYQALEAIRVGDPEKLKQAFYDDEKTNINLVSSGGGWGGFRFPTWGRRTYGGDPDGETLLHLSMRSDNAEKIYGFNVAYPKRYEIAKALYELNVDFSLRSAQDRIARDQNKIICDAVYPPSKWNNKMVLAWLISRGRALKHRDKWVELFDMLLITGDKLMSLGRKENFEHWFSENLSNLTRLGVPSGDLEREVMILYRILNQVVRDDRDGKVKMNDEEKKIWIENGGPEKAARLKAEQEGASGAAGEEEQNEESDVDDEGR